MRTALPGVGGGGSGGGIFVRKPKSYGSTACVGSCRISAVNSISGVLVLSLGVGIIVHQYWRKDFVCFGDCQL